MPMAIRRARYGLERHGSDIWSEELVSGGQRTAGRTLTVKRLPYGTPVKITRLADHCVARDNGHVKACHLKVYTAWFGSGRPEDQIVDDVTDNAITLLQK